METGAKESAPNATPQGSGINLKMLAQVLDSGTSEDSVAARLDALLRFVEGLAPGMRCSILLADTEQGVLHSCAAPSLPAAYCAAIDGIPIAEGIGSCGTAAARCAPVIVGDIATSSLWNNFHELAASHSLAACWSIPLIDRDGLLLGTSAAYYDVPRTPSTAEMDLVALVGSLASLVVQGHRTTQRLQASEQRYRVLAETSPDAVIVHELGTVVYSNRAAADLLVPESSASLLGERLETYFAPRFREAIGQLRTGSLTASLPQTSAPPRVLELFASQIVLDDRPMTMLVAHDISYLYLEQEAVRRLNTHLERRVAERTAELESANRELDSFCYSVSHDLRAPLRAIIGFASIMEEDFGADLPADCLANLTKILKYGQQMGALVDGLLALSRLGRLPVSQTRLNVRELLEACWTDLAPQRIDRLVEFQCGELLPCQGDPVLLKQVFLNLLSNAIKFTRDSASPRIVVESSVADDRVVYAIRDNGVGFDPRFKARLFQAFERLHTPADFEGNGIGLALVRQIVERHGGTVWAESAVNCGATFYVSLPQRTPTTEQQDAVASGSGDVT